MEQIQSSDSDSAVAIIYDMPMIREESLQIVKNEIKQLLYVFSLFTYAIDSQASSSTDKKTKSQLHKCLLKPVA